MSPGLLWAWHGLVTAARLELCSGSSTAASNTRVCFSRGKTWKRCVVVHRASDLCHTGANLPWPGVLREEQVGQVPPCYPGPPLVLGSGNLASAAFMNLLYVVLQAYFVRKLVASRGRIWQWVLEWKILTACKKVWLVLLWGNWQLAGVQLV